MREGGDQFSSAARKFSRVKSQETNSLQNKRRKVELYMEICKRKQKKQKKENSRLFQRKVYSSTGILLVYPSVLSFTKKVIRF